MQEVQGTCLVIIYTLLIILLVALIVLVVRTIFTMKKVDQVVDDVNGKVKKLNGIFTIIDNTTDALSLVGDHLVNGITNLVTGFFRFKKTKKEEKENE